MCMERFQSKTEISYIFKQLDYWEAFINAIILSIYVCFHKQNHRSSLNMINFSIFVNFIKKTEKISNLSILDQGHGYWHINSKVT